jgi:hypothetical protein
MNEVNASVSERSELTNKDSLNGAYKVLNWSGKYLYFISNQQSQHLNNLRLHNLNSNYR